MLEIVLIPTQVIFLVNCALFVQFFIAPTLLGITEWKIGHLLELDCIMDYYSNVSKHFRGEVVLTLAYPIKCHTLNFQMILQALRKFYLENIPLLIYIPRYVEIYHPLHIRDQNRSNMDLRFLNFIRFDYANNQTSYKCTMRKCYVAVDFTFSENNFFNSTDAQGENNNDQFSGP